MELVEETTHWQEGEMENEWESLALGPGWAPLLTASGQEEGKATGLPAGGPSCQWGVVQGSSLPGTHRGHWVRSRASPPLLSLPSAWLTCTVLLLKVWEVPVLTWWEGACPGPPRPFHRLTLLPSHEDLRLTVRCHQDRWAPVHAKA